LELFPRNDTERGLTYGNQRGEETEKIKALQKEPGNSLRKKAGGGGGGKRGAGGKKKEKKRKKEQNELKGTLQRF